MIQNVGFLGAFSLGPPAAVDAALNHALQTEPLPVLVQDMRLLTHEMPDWYREKEFVSASLAIQDCLKNPEATPKKIRYGLSRLTPSFAHLPSKEHQDEFVRAAAAARLQLGAMHFATAQNGGEIFEPSVESLQSIYQLQPKIAADGWRSKEVENERLADIYEGLSVWREPFAYWHFVRGQWLSHLAKDNKDLVRGERHYYLSAEHYAKMGAYRSAIDKFHLALLGSITGPVDYLKCSDAAVSRSLEGGYFVYAAKFSEITAKGLMDRIFGKRREQIPMREVKERFLNTITFLERAREAGNGHVLGRTVRMLWKILIEMETDEREIRCMQAAYDYSMARDFEKMGMWAGAILAYLTGAMRFNKVNEALLGDVAFKKADKIRNEIGIDPETFEELKNEAAQEADALEFASAELN